MALNYWEHFSFEVLIYIDFLRIFKVYSGFGKGGRLLFTGVVLPILKELTSLFENVYPKESS